MQVRKCLAPFFVGQIEAGLGSANDFETVLPSRLVDSRPGSVDAVVRVNEAIRDFVSETLAADEAPLVLAGDCLSAVGCLAGLERSNVAAHLIWFDAHGDFHTPETTLSGHLGGMPLAMISGRGEQQILRGVGLTPLADEHICHIGARDLEPGERECLLDSGIVVASRWTHAAHRIPKGSQVWVHFDTDYINPCDAPAMRYPAQGGPTAAQVRAELDAVVLDFDVIGLSVSAWAPHLDGAGEEARTGEICWQTLSGFQRL